MPNIWKDEEATLGPAVMSILFVAGVGFLVGIFTYPGVVKEHEEEVRRIKEDPRGYCLDNYSERPVREVSAKCLKYFVN